ncbi:MAG: hypothetical protein D6731_17490 [Planctomycetota bacterium]|nr:MAG: hypothetical protein D6731_17490 [Planctomycetota bacterium]
MAEQTQRSGEERAQQGDCEDPSHRLAGAALPGRLRRWLRRLAVGSAALLLGSAAFLWSCFATPPPLEGRPAILDAVRIVDARGRRRVGKSWFLRREGASLLYLEGDPFSIGYSNARLTAELFEEQERSLIETVRRFFPSSLSFWGVATLVLVNNRSLPDFVPEEYQREIHGLSLGAPDPFPELGPRYHRILNYHAAHDISHWVWDRPVVGCSAFAARGPETRSGHLLVGRNFDFEAGRHFDRNKIIGLYRPEQGYSFLSVSWPGMAGAVTGLNERRLYCSINGAHSSDRARIGEPVSLLVREVLQYCGTIEEAVERIRRAQVFVSDSYLVASGETGDAVVVEKTPARAEVRGFEKGDLLFQTNHFEAPGFLREPGNLEQLREGTTSRRRERLEELVHAARGRLDPPLVARILRDRRDVGGGPLALGHRGALNALIATHSVVCDVTAGILWVSRGPYPLGRYDAYRIDAFGEEVAPPIPADPLLASDAPARLERARALIAAAREAPEAHVAQLEEALALNPGDPDALRLLGVANARRGRSGRARRLLRAALRGRPAFPADRRACEELLARLGGGAE